MDHITFCRNYFAVTGLPVNLVNDAGVLYSSLGDLLDIPANNPVDIWPAEHNPEFRSLSSDIIYGSVLIEETGDYVFVGPVFSIPVTDDLIRQYMREQATPLDYKEAVTEALSSIPRLTHAQFCRHLVFLHQCLNHKEISAQDLIAQNVPPSSTLEERHLQSITDNMENERFHNTYYFEQELYQHVRSGNIRALNDFLTSTTLNFQEGRLAQTPLRQAKNLFIGTVTKIGMLGAIPGGVDVEKTYQLIDLYIQECEKLQSLDAIHSLQYSMVLDFCRKAGESQMPDGISREVSICVSYIRSHTNEPIGVEDVAYQIHRSNSYIMKKFKEELGFTIAAFITRCKLEEAKSLLTYSDRSLAEISSYLCFSSQPHFQNLFKKQYQMTPLEYRKKIRKS